MTDDRPGKFGRHDRSSGGSGQTLFLLGLLVLLSLASPAGPARAARLSDVFRDEFGGLELEPLGRVLADSVASTYPVASASSSVTYVYNSRLEAFERRTRVLGPIIGERAETIGARQMNVGVSYSYVDLARIDGHDLDDLENRPVVDGRVIAFPVPGGVQLADGRFTNFLPVHVRVDLDVDANLVSPFVTYGLTPDWDLNVTLPIVETSLRAKVRSEIPDPRLAQFTIPPGSPLAGSETRVFSESSAGIGDLLLRTKFVFLRGGPLDLAAVLGLSLPTGNEEDLQGTGTTRVQPALVASRTFLDRVQPLLDVGIDINANDAARSIVRWAAGATAQVVGPLTAAAVFLGRHELEEQTDPIDAPFFFQIERNDVLDVAVGLRVLFAESGVISLNALLPLNDQGLRAEAVPTVEVQYAFPTR